MCIRVGAGTENTAVHVRVKRQLVDDLFSPPTMWAWLRSSGLASRVFTCWAISQVLYLDLMVEASRSFHIRKPLEIVAFHLILSSMRHWKRVSNIFWFVVSNKQWEILFPVWVGSIGFQPNEALNYIAVTCKDLEGKKWGTEESWNSSRKAG